MPYVANCNIVGPDGELVEKDKLVPSNWSKKYMKSLLEGKAISEIPEIEEEDSDVG